MAENHSTVNLIFEASALDESHRNPVDKSRDSLLVSKNSVQVASGRCPSCGGQLIEKRCYKCKFCGICGMKWEGISCQNCFPVANTYSTPDGNAADGEAALERSDMSKLFGRNISTTEHNLYRSLSFDGERAKTHEMVQNAVSSWTLPEGAKKRIVDTIVTRVSKELRNGDPQLKPLITSLLREEAASLGLDLKEVTRALAVMGLNAKIHLRQSSHWLVVAAIGSASLKVSVDGIERGIKAHKISEDTEQWESWLLANGYSETANIFRVRVPLYLTDAIDKVSKIKVANGVILDYERKRQAMLVDRSSLRIKQDYRRSFYAFKSMKKALVDDGAQCRTEVDRINFARRFMLGKGKFPISSEIATMAGCSTKINALFLNKFREKKTEGRAWNTVAMEALREADEEIFSSFPRLKRGQVLMYARDILKVRGRKLAKQDSEHTGLRGILVLSEFDEGFGGTD